MGDQRPAGLVAFRDEIKPALARLVVASREKIGDAIFYAGQIAGRQAALAAVLAGPVHGALGAQALVLRYGARSLISFGSAGALDPSLAPGDLVIARRAVAHDAGVFLADRFVPFGVPGYDHRGRVGYRRAFEADPGLVDLALHASEELNVSACAGTVVTGNQVVFSSARNRWLRQTFDALAVEMESAAVAQVAAAYGLPWVAIRGISDPAGDETFDLSRFLVTLDGSSPPIRRWAYALMHPGAVRRLRQLRNGLAVAAERAVDLVAAMLRLQLSLEP